MPRPPHQPVVPARAWHGFSGSTFQHDYFQSLDSLQMNHNSWITNSKTNLPHTSEFSCPHTTTLPFLLFLLRLLLVTSSSSDGTTHCIRSGGDGTAQHPLLCSPSRWQRGRQQRCGAATLRVEHLRGDDARHLGVVCTDASVAQPHAMGQGRHDIVGHCAQRHGTARFKGPSAMHAPRRKAPSWPIVLCPAVPCQIIPGLCQGLAAHLAMYMMTYMHALIKGFPVLDFR